MPFYFDVNRASTTNGSANTESTHLRALTVANQATAFIMSFFATARSGTAGGGSIRVKTWTTPSTGGTSQTPAKRNPNSAAASTTFFNDATAITPGTTAVVRASIGIAQTGGTGGWMALEPDHALQLLANGGANGNADFLSIANGTSVAFDLTVEHRE